MAIQTLRRAGSRVLHHLDKAAVRAAYVSHFVDPSFVRAVTGSRDAAYNYDLARRGLQTYAAVRTAVADM
jgi:hypothetical protein